MVSTIVKKILIKLGYHSQPNFIIIGAQKAGTTSLFSILKQHSYLMGADKKEIHFFDRDDSDVAKLYNQYHQHFPLPNKLKNKLTFEATPSYLYHPEAAKRIKLYNPDIKLIIILRNPAERALSAWSMYHYRAEGHKKYAYLLDKRSFTNAIEDELKIIEHVNWYTDKYSYIRRGIYYEQINEYFNNFSRDQILIIEHRELKNEHDTTIKKICDFLTIPYQPLKQQHLLQNIKKNENEYRNEIDKLNEFYKPHNKLLFNLIKKEYNW
ncbi:MAG TPA: sulfotransferase [Bacteroidia bacterium]|nr:sulfotransferase [Bacteroidia bacterium]